MPLILGTNSIKDTGYNVANSCRFDGSSSYLTSGSFGTATSGTTWTFSLWVKRSEISSANYICGSYDGSRTNSLDLVYDAADTLSFYHGSDDGNGKLVKPARLFRDISAWTHIVWSVDTTQGTAANRVKVYFNGVEDAKATATYPDQNAVAKLFADTNNKIGSQWNATSGTIFDGYMAEIVFIDGLQLAATSFGEFNEDSPAIWQPINVSGLTFGNNGFYLDFEDSSDLGKDVSGKGNDFTATNLAAADQATDTPTNNFCTMNPLTAVSGWSNVSAGNLQVELTTDNDSIMSTMAPANGKWYWEEKRTSQGTRGYSGVADWAVPEMGGNGNRDGSTEYAALVDHNGQCWGQGVTINSHTKGSAPSDNDIFTYAVDLDNGQVWCGVNEDVDVSGTANVTGLATGVPYFYFIEESSGGGANTSFQINFGGSSPFTISSSNSDANGYGNFEYAVPSGYFALCTKNLGENG